MLRSTINKRLLSTTSNEIKKTPLFELHNKIGGKMVPFAGYSMPLLYPNIQNHIESHKWVRSHAGLFDVSHMLQSKLSGKDAIKLLHRITPTDFNAVNPSFGSLSVLLKQDGGIIDDLMIFKRPEGDADEGFYIVTNASRVNEDSQFILENVEELTSQGYDIKWEPISGQALLALQGPKASSILSSLLPTSQNLDKLVFGQRKTFNLPCGTPIGVLRGGYTGEDGFEIAIAGEKAIHFSEKLLSFENVVKPIGLAARDSLRLEAGLCLYGNELNEKLTPVEGNLKWLISKTRRTDSSPETRFNGYEKIIDQLNNKSYAQTRIGFKYKSTDPAPAARPGSKLLDKDTLEPIGVVTSGSVSPSLSDEATKKVVNIGQGYVNLGKHKSGTELLVEVRRKKFPVIISKMPLVPTHYYRG
ncbi:aminomethyltransferase, mitochondrial [Monosporozyma unispora]|nr:Aminomethyltransferase, mitochondrial [Kazachstania unispora]